MTRPCLLCGHPLPPESRSWWKRWWYGQRMPTHSAQTDDPMLLDICYATFCERMGITPGPRPEL